MSSLSLVTTQRAAPDPADVCRRFAAATRAHSVPASGEYRLEQTLRTADGATLEVTLELLRDGGWAVTVIGGVTGATTRFLCLTAWEYPGQPPEVIVDDAAVLPAILRELEALT